MTQHYMLALTTDEISETVTALHQREIDLSIAIKQAQKIGQPSDVLLERLQACKRAADTIRVADKTAHGA